MIVDALRLVWLAALGFRFFLEIYRGLVLKRLRLAWRNVKIEARFVFDINFRGYNRIFSLQDLASTIFYAHHLSKMTSWLVILDLFCKLLFVLLSQFNSHR